MRINTLQLHRVSTCPRRYLHEEQIQEPIDPAREVIKRIFLTQGLGKETSWGIDRIASMWDELFWKGREVTPKNIDKSARGVLATKQLYSRLPQANFKSYSPRQLDYYSDSSLVLTSSADFILTYENKIESWVYLNSSPREIRRSILPIAEHYIVQKGFSRDLAFYLVIYHTTTNKMNPTYFKIRSKNSHSENRKTVMSLAEVIRNKTDYPIQNGACEKCHINC